MRDLVNMFINYYIFSPFILSYGKLIASGARDLLTHNPCALQNVPFFLLSTLSTRVLALMVGWLIPIHRRVFHICTFFHLFSTIRGIDSLGCKKLLTHNPRVVAECLNPNLIWRKPWLRHGRPPSCKPRNPWRLAAPHGLLMLIPKLGSFRQRWSWRWRRHTSTWPTRRPASRGNRNENLHQKNSIGFAELVPIGLPFINMYYIRPFSTHYSTSYSRG